MTKIFNRFEIKVNNSMSHKDVLNTVIRYGYKRDYVPTFFYHINVDGEEVKVWSIDNDGHEKKGKSFYSDQSLGYLTPEEQFVIKLEEHGFRCKIIELVKSEKRYVDTFYVIAEKRRPLRTIMSDLAKFVNQASDWMTSEEYKELNKLNDELHSAVIV